jgi:small subunit ribosomal protein S16
MLRIKLIRIGRRNQPSFQIVVTEKRSPPVAGFCVEKLGFFDPLTKKISLNRERIKYWLGVGAQPSATVYNLLVKERIIEGKKIPKHKKPKPKEKEEGKS